jgi:hypothetical protein
MKRITSRRSPRQPAAAGNGGRDPPRRLGAIRPNASPPSRAASRVRRVTPLSSRAATPSGRSSTPSCAHSRCRRLRSSAYKYCYKSVCPEGHRNCRALVEPADVVHAALALLADRAA